jgi:hypothetical protein
MRRIKRAERQRGREAKGQGGKEATERGGKEQQGREANRPKFWKGGKEI